MALQPAPKAGHTDGAHPSPPALQHPPPPSSAVLARWLPPIRLAPAPPPPHPTPLPPLMTAASARASRRRTMAPPRRPARAARRACSSSRRCCAAASHGRTSCDYPSSPPSPRWRGTYSTCYAIPSHASHTSFYPLPQVPFPTLATPRHALPRLATPCHALPRLATPCGPCHTLPRLETVTRPLHDRYATVTAQICDTPTYLATLITVLQHVALEQGPLKSATNLKRATISGEPQKLSTISQIPRFLLKSCNRSIPSVGTRLPGIKAMF